MARLAFIIILLLAIVIGVGFYVGWFHLSSDRSNGDPNYTVTVDKEKIKADEARANKKLQEMGQEVREKVAPATQP